MKILKILLVLVFALVAGLYGLTEATGKMSGKNVGPELRAESPVLELSVHDGDVALMNGITAWDQQDGDLTGSVLISGVSKFITPGTARVSYLVFDRDQNVATLNRELHYTDYTSPRFSIKSPLIYNRNENIALLDRVAAQDCVDGDVTSQIRVSPLTATGQAETYTVNLQVTNSKGDTARLTLPVIQLEGTANRPEVRLSEYLVYLSVGSAFNARSYLRHVVTPDGAGSVGNVEITGQVDTATPGTYMVCYTYPYETAPGTAILTVVVE